MLARGKKPFLGRLPRLCSSSVERGDNTDWRSFKGTSRSRSSGSKPGGRMREAWGVAWLGCEASPLRPPTSPTSFPKAPLKSSEGLRICRKGGTQRLVNIELSR